MIRVGVIGGYCQLLEALRENARLERKIQEMFGFQSMQKIVWSPWQKSKLSNGGKKTDLNRGGRRK